MLFSAELLIVGGATLAVALADKTLSSMGFHMLGDILRILLPIVAFAAAVYFLEFNALIGWLLR